MMERILYYYGQSDGLALFPTQGMLNKVTSIPVKALMNSNTKKEAIIRTIPMIAQVIVPLASATALSLTPAMSHLNPPSTIMRKSARPPAPSAMRMRLCTTPSKWHSLSAPSAA